MRQRRPLFWLFTLLSASLLTACQQENVKPAVPVQTQAPLDDEYDYGEPVTHQSVYKTVTKQKVILPQPKTENNLWVITRNNFGLDTKKTNTRIASHIRWLQKYPQYMPKISERAAPYYHYILNETIRQGLPAEIALLPIVESAYDPFAYSHGRAAGIWQFIPSTGKHFGLKQTWWYDGRRDVVASTQAALKYLKQLHKRFDDWELALAAYNTGGGNISKAIRKNKEAGKKTDFWSLNLHSETTAYVPRLIAVAKIIKNPSAYGVDLPPIPNRPVFTVVETGSQIDLAQAAKLADISTDRLYKLNPGFNRWATDPDGPHYLAVPVEKASLFTNQLAQMDDRDRVQWQRYKVQKGDNLIAIAKRYNTTTNVVRTANNIDGNLIRIGQTLLIPSATGVQSEYALSQNQRLEKKHASIARRSDRAKTEYRVKSGDSFWRIAKRNHVTVDQLAKWNNMRPNAPLQVGKKLVIFKANSVASSSSHAVTRKVDYRVRGGDSLGVIAGKFKVSVKNILEWNDLNIKHYLQPGQLITLFVDVTSQ